MRERESAAEVLLRLDVLRKCFGWKCCGSAAKDKCCGKLRKQLAVAEAESAEKGIIIAESAAEAAARLRLDVRRWKGARLQLDVAEPCGWTSEDE